jgi:type I restriction enzyme M protein
MQGKQLRKLENELWRAADQPRANSKLIASEMVHQVFQE